MGGAVQGVPLRHQNDGLHCAEAECGALHSTLAGRAPELWHERNLDAHEKPAVPHQLLEVRFWQSRRPILNAPTHLRVCCAAEYHIELGVHGLKLG